MVPSSLFSPSFSCHLLSIPFPGSFPSFPLEFLVLPTFSIFSVSPVHPSLGAARRHPSQPDGGAASAQRNSQETQRVHAGGDRRLPQALDTVCRNTFTHRICCQTSRHCLHTPCTRRCHIKRDQCSIYTTHKNPQYTQD